jgi:hypothetical protein
LEPQKSQVTSVLHAVYPVHTPNALHRSPVVQVLKSLQGELAASVARRAAAVAVRHVAIVTLFAGIDVAVAAWARRRCPCSWPSAGRGVAVAVFVAVAVCDAVAVAVAVCVADPAARVSPSVWQWLSP